MGVTNYVKSFKLKEGTIKSSFNSIYIFWRLKRCINIMLLHSETYRLKNMSYRFLNFFQDKSLIIHEKYNFFKKLLKEKISN